MYGGDEEQKTQLSFGRDRRIGHVPDVLWYQIFSFLLLAPLPFSLWSQRAKAKQEEDRNWGLEGYAAEVCLSPFSGRSFRRRESEWRNLRQVSSFFYRIASSRVVLSYLEFVLETDSNGHWPMDRFCSIRDLLLYSDRGPRLRTRAFSSSFSSSSSPSSTSKASFSVAAAPFSSFCTAPVQSSSSVSGSCPSLPSSAPALVKPSVALSFLFDPGGFADDVLPQDMLSVLFQLLQSGSVRTLTFGCLTLPESLFLQCPGVGTGEGTVFPQVKTVNICFCNVPFSPRSVRNRCWVGEETTPVPFSRSCSSFLQYFPELETLNIQGPFESEGNDEEKGEDCTAPGLSGCYHLPRPKHVNIEYHDALDLHRYSQVFFDLSRLVSVTLVECSVSEETLQYLAECSRNVETIVLGAGCFVDGNGSSPLLLDVDFSKLDRLRWLDIRASPFRFSQFFLEHCLPPHLQELFIRDHSPRLRYVTFLQKLLRRTRLPPKLDGLTVEWCPPPGQEREEPDGLCLTPSSVVAPCAATSFRVEFPDQRNLDPRAADLLSDAFRTIPFKFPSLRQLAVKFLGLCSPETGSPDALRTWFLTASPRWRLQLERLSFEWVTKGNWASTSEEGGEEEGGDCPSSFPFSLFRECSNLTALSLRGFPGRWETGPNSSGSSGSSFLPGVSGGCRLTQLDVSFSKALTDDALAFLLSSFFVQKTVRRLYVQGCPRLTLRSLQFFSSLPEIQEISVDYPEPFSVGSIPLSDPSKVLLPSDRSPGLFRLRRKKIRHRPSSSSSGKRVRL
jgi:hypothetical protein